MNRFFEKIVSIPLWPLLGISTSEHHSMVKDCRYVKKLKKATYRNIEAMMLITDWYFDPSFPTSLFTMDDSAYFHASIFRFGDVGYLLTPYGYLRACMLQRKIRRTLPKFQDFKKPYVK